MSDVAIIMGSDSDWPIMEEAAKLLEHLQISFSVDVVSAHRMPVEMMEFAQSAQTKGYKVIIAGAGGAAHLPGMVAALTPLPVIGVPVALKNLDGMDSLLSIVQMPSGVPVATVGIGNAKNAALLAARILGVSDMAVREKVSQALVEINSEAKEKAANLATRRNQKTGF
jgi:5-(carboxyamino)imidazole ribonucleotide mutase